MVYCVLKFIKCVGFLSYKYLFLEVDFEEIIVDECKDLFIKMFNGVFFLSRKRRRERKKRRKKD